MSYVRDIVSRMSTTNARRRKATTDRGRKILAALDAQGLTLQAAAERARVSYGTIQRAIHSDPGFASVSTVEALCKRLSLPLELVAPQLAAL